MEITSPAGIVMPDQVFAAWWWLDRESPHVWQTSSGARAWEILRRTRSYRAFFDRMGSISKPSAGDLVGCARYLSGIRSMVETYPLGSKDPARNWTELFLNKCKPQYSWAELSKAQRALVEKLPMLPRQDSPEIHGGDMFLAIYEMTRDALGRESITRKHWSGHDPLHWVNEPILHENCHSRVYVVINFDSTLPPPALKRQLLDAISLALRRDDGTPESEAKDQKWKEFRENLDTAKPSKLKDSAESALQFYPRIWRDSLSAPCIPPHSHDPRVRVVSSIEFPRVMCWIPAEHNIPGVLAKFNNAVRHAARDLWLPKCHERWEQSEVVNHPELATGNRVRDGGKVTLPPYPKVEEPPSGLKRKPAKMKKSNDVFVGLTAYDIVQDGLTFHDPMGKVVLKALYSAKLIPEPDRYYVNIALAAVRSQIERIDLLYCSSFP